MYGNDNDPHESAATKACVTIGCLTAFVIERAREMGCAEHADAMDECLDVFLKTLPLDQRRTVLQSSYAMMVADHLPEPVRLKLVHSRD